MFWSLLFTKAMASLVEAVVGYDSKHHDKI